MHQRRHEHMINNLTSFVTCQQARNMEDARCVDHSKRGLSIPPDLLQPITINVDLRSKNPHQGGPLRKPMCHGRLNDGGALIGRNQEFSRFNLIPCTVSSCSHSGPGIKSGIHEEIN